MTPITWTGVDSAGSGQSGKNPGGSGDSGNSTLTGDPTKNRPVSWRHRPDGGVSGSRPALSLMTTALKAPRHPVMLATFASAISTLPEAAAALISVLTSAPGEAAWRGWHRRPFAASWTSANDGAYLSGHEDMLDNPRVGGEGYRRRDRWRSYRDDRVGGLPFGRVVARRSRTSSAAVGRRATCNTVLGCRCSSAGIAAIGSTTALRASLRSAVFGRVTGSRSAASSPAAGLGRPGLLSLLESGERAPTLAPARRHVRNGRAHIAAERDERMRGWRPSSPILRSGVRPAMQKLDEDQFQGLFRAVRPVTVRQSFPVRAPRRG